MAYQPLLLDFFPIFLQYICACMCVCVCVCVFVCWLSTRERVRRFPVFLKCFYYLQAPKRLWARRWLFSPLRLLKNLTHSRHTWILVALGTIFLCFLKWLTIPAPEKHNLLHKIHVGNSSLWMLIDSNSSLLIIFINPSARVGYDARSFFKRSLTGFNSEFSFT